MIHTECIVRKPIQIVWTAYTEPEHIVHWNFANDDWCCPHASNDLRVGGTYTARMEAKDGSFGFDFEVVYDEVIPMEKIRYTMGDGRKAVITLNALSNDETQICVDFEAETMNPAEMQQQGWQAILDNFGKYCASLN